MRKILYCILPIFLCSILSCDRKRQSDEQDMKDSLAAANFMKCAKFLYNTLFDDDPKCLKPRIFIKYKQPVNGYDVTVMCLPYNYTYDKERDTEIWGMHYCILKSKIADFIFTMRAFLIVFFIM